MTLEYIILDLDKNLTCEDYLNAIEKNHSTAISMKKEMLPIINQQSKKKEKTNIIIESEIIENQEKNINQDFEDEVDYYLTMIDSIKNTNNLKEELHSVLPSKNNPNYYNIITRINAEFLKQIKEIQELIEEEKQNFTKEDMMDFKNEILYLSNRMNQIRECEEETQKDDEHIENNLIFVPTTSGNIRVLEEINHIDDEYYDSFTGLFNSIKDGTFKNVKKFATTNNKNSGVSEVKDFKIRVVFDRIGKNDYALITAFIKKSDNDRGYIESLGLKVKNYMNQKDELKSLLEDDDFRKSNKEYEEQLYNTLSSSKLNKRVKQKRG